MISRQFRFSHFYGIDFTPMPNDIVAKKAPDSVKDRGQRATRRWLNRKIKKETGVTVVNV